MNSISRRAFGRGAAGFGMLAAAAQSASPQSLPGIWRHRLGVPERITPVSTRHYQPAHAALGALPQVAHPPNIAAHLQGQASRRGYHLTLPLEPGELIYGFGLQFQSFLQRGRKKTLRV